MTLLSAPPPRLLCLPFLAAPTPLSMIYFALRLCLWPDCSFAPPPSPSFHLTCSTTETSAFEHTTTTFTPEPVAALQFYHNLNISPLYNVTWTSFMSPKLGLTLSPIQLSLICHQNSSKCISQQRVKNPALLSSTRTLSTTLSSYRKFSQNLLRVAILF
jgi:hypothetical protein